MLREEMAAVGLDPEAIDVREVSSDADAQREEFIGSPTIRVDGRDIQPLPDEPIGLACRIYWAEDGGVSPVPNAAEVRQTLIAAMEGGED